MNDREMLFASLIHDAEIELGREGGDCLLSHLGYHEAVLSLAAEHARLREALEAERDEARKALNGFVWLNDNIHNYGSSRWLEFWDSAIQDCCAALAAPTKEGT